MKVKRIQLAELYRGNSVYQLLQLKGEISRFVITKQNALGNDDRTHRVAIERTLPAAMVHWEKLFLDKDNDDIDREFQPH